MDLCTRQNVRGFVHAAVIVMMTVATSDACTVFVMTDGRQVLFATMKIIRIRKRAFGSCLARRAGTAANLSASTMAGPGRFQHGRFGVRLGSWLQGAMGANRECKP